jgi:hypothetical protein
LIKVNEQRKRAKGKERGKKGRWSKKRDRWTGERSEQKLHGSHLHLLKMLKTKTCSQKRIKHDKSERFGLPANRVGTKTESRQKSVFVDRQSKHN